MIAFLCPVNKIFSDILQEEEAKVSKPSWLIAKILSMPFNKTTIYSGHKSLFDVKR